MTTKYVTRRSKRQDELLHQLIQARGLAPGDYSVFFATGDGVALPGSDPDEQFEASSGYVLDRSGQVHFYKFGWHPEAHRVDLIEWEPAAPQAHWQRSREYQRARAAVGLSTG
jgi:hypothetical protein